MRRYVRDRRGRFARTGFHGRSRRLPRKTGYKAPWSEDLIGRRTRALGRTPVIQRRHGKVTPRARVKRTSTVGWER
jgi:hypothetical protein